MKWTLLTVAALALMGCAKTVAPEPEIVEAQNLGNGLQVVVKHLDGAQAVALVVLYSVGEKHDPEGASGLAHLIEHLYVTSAAGDQKARDIDGYLEAYPEGWNAQTGDDYTVIATVFKRERLQQELADAAARMASLEVTDADLKRELPRLEGELANMYRSVPSLAAQNLAAQAVVPPAVGARRGGVPEQLEAITLEQVRQRLDSLYKPNNAIVVLVGDIDVAEAEGLIASTLGAVAKGEAPTDLGLALSPTSSGTVELDATGVPGSVGYAALAYRAPKSTSADYPAFLALTAYLHSRAPEFDAGRGVQPVQYAPLDRPEVLLLSAPALEGERADMAAGRIERIARRAVEEAPIDREMVQRSYGFLLGLGGTDASEMALNPYGVAFGIARRKQLGLDPAVLAKGINDLTDADLDRVRESVFAQKSTGRAIVRTAPVGR